MDKAIIKMILKNELGLDYTNMAITELGIPRTTFNRRLKYLKTHYIQTFNDLNQKALKFRRLDLLISTTSDAVSVGKELMTLDEVIAVTRRIGEQDVDLRAEIIIKDNKELSDLIDRIKSINGVKEIKWSEIIEVIGRKKAIPDSIIDML